MTRKLEHIATPEGLLAWLAKYDRDEAIINHGFNLPLSIWNQHGQLPRPKGRGLLLCPHLDDAFRLRMAV